jgi:hypothetical protein
MGFENRSQTKPHTATMAATSKPPRMPSGSMAAIYWDAA